MGKNWYDPGDFQMDTEGHSSDITIHGYPAADETLTLEGLAKEVKKLKGRVEKLETRSVGTVVFD